MEKNHLPKGFTFYNKISILDPKEMTDCAEVDVRIKMTAGQTRSQVWSAVVEKVITGPRQMMSCMGRKSHQPGDSDVL